jgi:hypothetical protein
LIFVPADTGKKLAQIGRAAVSGTTDCEAEPTVILKIYPDRP